MSDPLGPPVSGTHTFIIRLWAEEAEPGVAARFRGSVTNVMTSEKRYFIKPAAIPALISEMIAAGDDPDDDSSRSAEKTNGAHTG